MIGLIIMLVVLAILMLTLYPLIVGTAPVPTPQRVGKKMLEMAEIKKGETVYDLGCGDGRLVFAAAEQGANATGFEISPLVFLWAWIRSLSNKSTAKIKFRDFLTVNLKDADKILLYMYPTTNRFLLPKKFKRELKPGAQIISYAFKIHGLKLVNQVKAGPKYGEIFVYQI